MTALWVAPFFLAIAASNVFTYLASRNLSAYGEQRRLRLLLWSRWFASREHYTDLGWRYRNAALLCLAFLPVYFVVVFLGRGPRPAV